MQLEQKIEKIIQPAVSDLGFEIVRVQVSGDQNLTLQIMAEPILDKTMTVEHCAMISRAVAAVLNLDDPIKRDYTLEVSSPGIDRPWTILNEKLSTLGQDQISSHLAILQLSQL